MVAATLATRLVASALLAAAVILGCASQPPSPPPPVPPTTARPTIEATVARVNIFDERSDVDAADRTLHMPENTIVGDKDEIKPPLTYGERQLIESTTKAHFEPGKRTVEVDVYVTDGRQTFEVAEMRETVTVAFALRIEIADRKNVIDVVTAEGEATLSEHAVDLSTALPAQLYAKAIRESLDRAFAKLGAGS